MNITLNNIDPVNATITVNVVKDDYTDLVNKEIIKIRSGANIPGFRKGMAPKTMIQKMYGKAVLIEEINKLVSEKLYGYIRENTLTILGEPLPHKGEQAPLDFDNQEDYEFIFDIGLAPEIKYSLTKKNKLPYYTIQADDAMIESRISGLKASFGSYEQANEVEEKDMVKGLLTELNPDGSVKEDGLSVTEAMLMPSYIKDEDEKKKFMGAKLNDTIVFNPNKAYEGNEAELSSFLKVKKEELAGYTGDFSLRIDEITRYKEAELNQALFDKVYGEGVVKSEEEFKAKLKEEIEEQTVADSDYKFLIDVRKLLLDKTKDIAFPDEFLKRWLLESNPDKKEDVLEEEYPKIIEDLCFHLIKEQIVKDNDIKVEQEEVKQMAFKAARAQFAQYGMTNVPDQLLENYAQEMFKKEDTVRNLVDKVVEDKIIVILKDKVALDIKPVTVDEFNKLFEN